MKLELTIYSCLCATSVFRINDIPASSFDFGNQFDRNSEDAEDYACGNMEFTRIEATKDVLDKYKITLDEYDEIATQLEDKLSFGSCGWCV